MVGKRTKDEEKIKGFDRWTVKDAMRTLQQVEKIKQDKALMEAVAVVAQEELQAIAAVAAHAKAK